MNGTKQRRAPAGARSSYDRFKEFDGKRYTGMKVGRRHKWRYDPGEWMEKKVTPDKWEFTYAVKKHRAGKAPEGSGAPVGTAYRWYILANQIVTKQDANSYTTEMAGLKYKLAHKRADKESWSASDRAQRKRLAQILREMIAELEKHPEKQPEGSPLAVADHDQSHAKKSEAASSARGTNGAGSASAHRTNGSAKRARPLPARRSTTRARTREKRAAA